MGSGFGHSMLGKEGNELTAIIERAECEGHDRCPPSLHLLIFHRSGLLRWEVFSVPSSLLFSHSLSPLSSSI